MSREVLLDLGFLTEDERDLINNVISKDAEIRKAEQSRIGSLRKELDEIKENGLSEDELESKNEKYCARCQTYFGIILNRGADCPRCELKVCKVCRVNDIDDGWICTLCNKVREVKAQSGAWFFQGHKEKNGNLFGSLLVRQSLRRLPGIQPKGHKEPSNPFIEDEEPSNPFIEDEDTGNPFTSGKHGRSSERLSGQADLNSNQAKRNGGHKMGYQYSDESEDDSEQRSHDGSLEYNHDDTASDRTLSKGESDSSESLDSDHDETLAANVDELSPVATREMALRAKPNTAKQDGHSGGNVEQQGLPKDTEYEFGISKDTQDIRDRPPSFNQDAHQSGGNVVQKRLVRYTKSDEGTVRNTQKVRSRPGSLSLDEDMSYVSAPRFNIPLKRRQSSGNLSISEARSDEGFEKHRSRSEEYLSKSERMLDRNEPSADVIIACKKTRDEIKDQNISGTLEDVFGTGESNYKDIEIDLKDESKVDIPQNMFDMRNELSADDISPEGESDEETHDDDGRLEFSIHEDTVCKESGIVVESSPEILSDNFSADNIAAEVDIDEFTRDDDETAHRESGIVVDISPNVNQHEYSNPKQLSEQDFEIPSTDEKRKGSYDDSISDSDSRQNGTSDLPNSVIAENENSPGNVVGDSDDNTEVMSVFSRVKNWERRSTEDRFGADVKEENRKGFNNQGGETIKDKYEITIDLSENNKEIAVPASAERVEDIEHRQTRDLSPVGKASVDDMPFINEGPSENVDKEPSPSPEVLQTSVDMEMELQPGSYEKNDISLDNHKISSSEVMQDEFPSENITVETSTNSGKTEMELQQESYDETSSDNVNPSEAMLDDFPSENITLETSLNLEKTEMELQQESYDDITSDNVIPSEAILDDFPSENITVETSLNLEKTGMELQQESYDDTSSDNVNPSEAILDDFPSDNITVETSLNLEKTEMELQQESYDDITSDNVNADNEVPRMSAHFEKEKTSPSDSEDDAHKSDEKEKTSPSDSEDDAHKSVEKEKTSPFDSEEDVHKSDDETKPLRDLETRTDLEISETNQDTRPEPHTSETTVVQSANEEPASPDSRINAMRAFSEAFATTNLGMKGHEAREDREKHEDHEYREESGHHEDSETREDRDTHEDRDTREDPEYVEDQETREDRGYHAGQYAPEERGSSEDAREDRGYREENEGPDSRRSSDLHYEGFHGDNESMISETSGYGTPSASEDTSSKRTPSISGDEGMNTPTEEARRLPSESAPVIVTTEAADEAVLHDANSFRNSSITDFEEDLDVSFSKYGTGLGNRMLKDQLSMGSRESIVSYYSNAGGEVYGNYPVSGEILFGIKYDPKIQEFQVQIHQGRDITAVDKKTETSDPYVKTYLLPDRSRTGKRKSKVKKNTVNPVFDEILTYKISYDEILQRTLWLAIWNHDTFGHNDFLGEVLVPIDQYHQSGFSLEDPEPQWYELCERKAEDQQFSYNGEIVFSLKYVPPSALVSNKKKKKKKKADEEKGELHINIVEASNLLAKDANGFSDPFCKSYLLPDKSKKSKQKTPVVKKSLNPKWNYHFVYDNVTHEELMDRVLELTIWDFDRGSSNEFLGGVRLGLGAGIQEWDDATSEEQAAWNKMLNNQNDWNQVSLTLREHMGHHKLCS